MKQGHLHLLLDYHYWARDRVLTAAAAVSPAQFTKDLGNSFPSIRDTLVHTYGAEVIWRTRWQGNPPVGMPAFEAFPDVPALDRAWSEHERLLRSVVASFGEEGVGRMIEYQTMAGTPFAQPLWQMVQHVVNHASYHRGQVTTMLRQLGAPPPEPMDMSAFYRER